ncbi:MAG: GntR family transcriptional regulator [Acidobacteriota bacterium]
MQSLVELDPEMLPIATLPDRVYEVLKHRILTCAIPPGQRLIEKDLCAELGVSRTPLREALNRLAHERLVNAAPFRGYTVTEFTLAEARSLCEVRGIVECGSATLAAERAGEQEIEELARLAELRYTPGQRETYQDYLRANSTFHLALVRCTHNLRLETIVMSVLDQLQRPIYFGLDVGLDPDTATAEHLQIVAAVRAHDPAGARRLMAEQIANSERRILEAVQAACSGTSRMGGIS